MSNWWDADPVANAAPERSPYADAISGIESGGNYRAVGPTTKTGDRAVGKYQVMGANVGPWTEEVLGTRMNPLQFLASPEAQDKVFNAKFKSYVDKYGPEGAAKAWFAGERGMNNPNAKDILGTSVSGYAEKFNKAVGPQQAQAQTGNWWDADPVSNAPLKITVNPVAERFAETPAPQNAPALESGLQRQARDMTTGAPTAPAQRMAIEHGNLMSAASQGATPNVDILSKNLISTEVFQGDDGSVQYRDPQTGQVVPTDNTKHIVMRDPADNTPKVYARTDAANENPAVGLARTLAPGAMAGAPTARAAIPAMKNVDVRASDIQSTAKPYYRAFEQQARAAPPPEGAADRIRAALDSIGLSEEMAGAPIRSALSLLESGKVTSLNDMQKVKRMVGHGFASPDKAVRDAAAVVSAEIGKIINDVAPTAAANLKTGDAIHSTARAVQDLQRKGAVADLRSGRAGYGGNAVNTMRQVLAPIVQRSVEGRNTPFKPDEIAAMRQIVEGTPVTNALRLAGQFSPTSGLGAIKAAGAGGAGIAAGASGGMAMAIPALGYASNKLATFLTGKQIDHLRELVAKRSPEYAKAVEKSVERYEKAQLEWINNPTPNTLSAYISGSRALSSGLTRDGIQVTSGSLLKMIEGPVKSAAEGEEPSVPGRPGQ